ncbi:uncharacterized protein G2W53_040932 [Senna tora]|uniref:Uncharacterized protein n=1 Tax=Senna tora TaxID=362788 RepID=A0A834SEX4_9FABA|nr:uncharacterized protein G2W53_040932 [Senna tora]
MRKLGRSEFEEKRQRKARGERGRGSLSLPDASSVLGKAVAYTGFQLYNNAPILP